MKKIITIVPLFTLLVACNMSESKKEYNLFESKEKFLAYSDGMNKTFDVINKSKILNFEAAVKGVTLSLKADAKSTPLGEEKIIDTFKLNAAIKNFGFTAKGGVTGYTFEKDAVTEFKNLKAYANVEKFSTTVSLDYKLPDSLFVTKKPTSDSTGSSAEFDSNSTDGSTFIPALSKKSDALIDGVASTIKPKGKISSSISGMKAGFYFDNQTVYADLSDKKLYSFIDKFLNSGLIGLLPKQKEKYSSFDLITKLIPGFEGKLALNLNGIVPPSIELDGLEGFIDEEDTKNAKAYEKAVGETQTMFTEMNAKAYEYSKDSKYSYGLSININKDSLNFILPSLLGDAYEELLGKDVNIDALCEGLGIDIKKLENKLEIRFAKDGTVEFSAKLNNRIDIDLNKIIAAKIQCSSLKGSLVAKGEFNFKLFAGEKMEAFPKFDKYTPIALGVK